MAKQTLWTNSACSTCSNQVSRGVKSYFCVVNPHWGGSVLQWGLVNDAFLEAIQLANDYWFQQQRRLALLQNDHVPGCGLWISWLLLYFVLIKQATHISFVQHWAPSEEGHVVVSSHRREFFKFHHLSDGTRGEEWEGENVIPPKWWLLYKITRTERQRGSINA